jgi:hypothetical protein
MGTGRKMRGFAGEQLDLHIRAIRTEIATKTDLAAFKGDIMKWISVAYGLQTLAILGGVAALFRLFGHS